jgi:hypothetical protein
MPRAECNHFLRAVLLFSRGTSDIELSYQLCQQPTAAHHSRPSIRCRQDTRDQLECVNAFVKFCGIDFRGCWVCSHL